MKEHRGKDVKGKDAKANDSKGWGITECGRRYGSREYLFFADDKREREREELGPAKCRNEYPYTQRGSRHEWAYMDGNWRETRNPTIGK